MGNHQARQEEAWFFVLEQRSLRRRDDTPYNLKIFSRFYWLFADYGRSILRPFIGLCLVNVVAWFTYKASSPLYPEVFNDKRDVTDLVLSQLAFPFSMLSGKVDVEVFWMNVVGAIQSLLSLIFIAFLLLAVRWNFKRE